MEAGKKAHFKESGPGLNAVHKPVKDAYDVQTDIMEAVKAEGGDADRDSFETWGDLTGVNNYGDYDWMFVGGVFRKPAHHYKAIYAVAAKLNGNVAEEANSRTLNRLLAAFRRHVALRSALDRPFTGSSRLITNRKL